MKNKSADLFTKHRLDEAIIEIDTLSAYVQNMKVASIDESLEDLIFKIDCMTKVLHFEKGCLLYFLL